MTARRATHPPDEALRRVARDAAAEDAHRSHVATCARCRDEVSFLRALAEAAAMAAQGRCPDPLRLSLMAHGDAATADDASLQDHVIRCADCAMALESLEAATEIVRKRPFGVVAASRKLLAAPSDFAARLVALVKLEMPPSLEMAVRGAGDEVTAATRAGLAAYRRGRFDDARSKLREAVGEGARQPEAWLLLAACDLRAGDPSSAVALLERAVRARAREATYRWYLAQALMLSGDADSALRQLARVAKMPGSHASAARDLAAEIRTIRAQG